MGTELLAKKNFLKDITAHMLLILGIKFLVLPQLNVVDARKIVLVAVQFSGLNSTLTKK